jgi:hypothetical protein
MFLLKLLVLFLFFLTTLLSDNYYISYKAVISDYKLLNLKCNISKAMVENECSQKVYLDSFEKKPLNELKYKISTSLLKREAIVEDFTSISSCKQNFNQTTLLLPPTLIDTKIVSDKIDVFVCKSEN